MKCASRGSSRHDGHLCNSAAVRANSHRGLSKISEAATCAKPNDALLLATAARCRWASREKLEKTWREANPQADGSTEKGCPTAFGLAWN
jgi:hypothetical protein